MSNEAPAHIVTRRAFIIASSVSALSVAANTNAKQSDVAKQVAALEQHIGGRIGFAAFDPATRTHFDYRGDERFAMCSTFKWLLAAHVLSKIQQGTLTLAQRIAYSEHDLLPTSPVTQAHLAEGYLPVETLCEAIIQVSDNAAANLLLSITGGPQGLTQYLRQQGDRITRLDRNEPMLNSNLPGDERDTTTPNAMLRTMNTLLLGETLNDELRNRLLGWMRTCKTGLERLRAGLPSDWTVGDKTGTGAKGAVNDLAIAWPPNRRPILIVAYLSGSTATTEQLNGAHVELGKIVTCVM